MLSSPDSKPLDNDLLCLYMDTFAEAVILTIKEVARPADVFQPTISRALRNGRLVNPEAAKRIQRIGRELGYRLSGVGQSLVTQRTETIGVVVTNDMSAREYCGPGMTANSGF